MFPKKLELSDVEELVEFFNSFDHVLLDCDGVIYILFKLLEGAKESIESLRAIGKSVDLITNNSVLKTDELIDRLQVQGVTFEEEQIINPPKAIVDYLKGIQFAKKAYVIGMPGLREELEGAGIRISNAYEPEIFSAENFHKACSGILEEDPEVGAVIQCMDMNLNYFALNKACKYLQRPDVLFITTGYFKKVQITKFFSALGSSYFHDMIEDFTGREPVALAKPSKPFQEYVSKVLPYKPERVLFIGDDLVQDMRFAKEVGYRTLLVLSGTSKIEQMMECKETERPDFYTESLGGLHEMIHRCNLIT